MWPGICEDRDDAKGTDLELLCLTDRTVGRKPHVINPD